MLYKISGICFLQLLITLFAHAQSNIIRGTVLDGQTRQPLPYASVYINYTTIGTYANERGEFILSKLPSGEYDLIVSYIGHQPHQRKINLADSTEIVLTIRLDLLALKEVQIQAKRDASWYKQLEKFKKLFLGGGPSANLCKILNPWSLTFLNENGIFTAEATDLLEIENLNLGYRIFYQLKNFTVGPDKYLLSGYIRFKEYETVDSVLSKRWLRNRREAYEGSTRHFLKSIIDQRVEEEGYDLYEDRSGLKRIMRLAKLSANVDKTIFFYSTKGKVSPGKNPETYEVQLPFRLEVHYKDKTTGSRIYQDVPYPVSWIEIKGGFLNVAPDGSVLNPANMTVSGSMFEARIAELLPNDYDPGKKAIRYQNPIERKPVGALTYLTEKPYLHTDKSYYYPNEMIWFKGYMNYFAPLVKDSLSHVLYVDLMNSRNKLVTRRIFLITNGVAIGDLMVPSFIEKGDYILRAYTRWMLNFDPAYMFVKPIKVLDPNELVRIKDFQPDSQANAIIILSEKEEYDPKEKITLTMEVRDDLDNNISANLSVSITDLQQCVPAPNETTILSDFSMPVVSLPDTLDKRTRYRIQHGFDLQGRFVNAKGKPTQGLLTLVQETANLEFTITTEKDGSFFAPNLLLYDTAQLSFTAKTLQGRAGKVMFDSVTISPADRSAEPLQLEIYKGENTPKHYLPDNAPQAQILKAVTVKTTRLENQRSSLVLADYGVTGEWLRERHVTDVLSGLQIKVPGLRIIVVIDKDGSIRKYLMLGGPSGFGSVATQEPLVLIDGVTANEMEGGAAEQISQMNPVEIDRIEVTKFGMGAAYGARGGNGVISVYTRKGNLSPDRSDFGTYGPLQAIHTSSFSNSKEFTSPDYSTPDRVNSLPDYRSTIYWNPLVSTDGNRPAVVTFFAAELPTQYRVVVEGVTKEGKTVRSEKKLTIRKFP